MVNNFRCQALTRPSPKTINFDGPGVVIRAKAYDVDLSHSGRTIAGKAMESKGGFLHLAPWANLVICVGRYTWEQYNGTIGSLTGCAVWLRHEQGNLHRRRQTRLQH